MADARDRPVDDQRSLSGPLHWSDEPLAAGKVAERAGLGQLAGVGDRVAAVDAEPQVTSALGGDPRLGAGAERVGDHAAPAPQPIHVRAHHPRQHLLGHPRKRRDPRPRLARRLARGGVRERLDGRREHDVGGGHRRGQRAWRLAGVRVALVHEGEHGIRAGSGRLGAQALGEIAGRGVADDEDLLGLGDTETIAHYRPHGIVEIAHRTNPRARAPHA